MRFYVGGAGARAEAAGLVFYEEFADEGFAEARGRLAFSVVEWRKEVDSLRDGRCAGPLGERYIVS